MPASNDEVELFIGDLSPLLTVWRKLHVERDTMQVPELTTLYVTGSVGTITANAPVAGQSIVDLGRELPDGFDDKNMYEEGRIVFSRCPGGSDTFPVIESTGVSVISDSVTILGIPGACATASPYTLHDDDDYGVLGTVPAPHYPDGGQVLFHAFAEAYILPEYAIQAQTLVPFERTLDSYDVADGLGAWDDFRALQSTPAFWACFVIGCWEGEDTLPVPDPMFDGDPDLCFSLTPPYIARAGAETPTTGATDVGNRTAIFLQAIADDGACVGTTDEPHTVTHEIGHTCGSECEDHILGSIMQDGAPNNQHRFAPESLAVYRSQNPW